jgi:fucose 4-O-acetylase-like acetyltransferase
MLRRADIDRCRGFAILLVVFGHLVARQDPAGILWYEPLRRCVYAFHMPLFLYLSGLTAIESGYLIAPRAASAPIARRRAVRLLVPFFGFGMLALAGKLALAPFLHVDHAPAGLGRGLAALFWHTANSPAGAIWYLAVLFVCGLGGMLALNGQVRRLRWLALAAGALFLIPLPAYCYLDQLGRYGVFFFIGACVATRGERWTRWVDRVWPAALLGLATGLAALAWAGADWPPRATLLVFGVLSMPAIHGLFRFLPVSSPDPFLWLGRYSFVIYLFNTMFIGLTKGLLLLNWSWDGANFLGFAAALMLAGTFGPIALRQAVLRRVQLLYRLTG